METTNYEISKRLHELGFEAENYDLETLIDSMPKQYGFSDGALTYGLRVWFEENSSFIGYQSFDGFNKSFTLETQKNESLADTAGRLLIKLIEEGIVKTNKEVK